MAYKQQKLFSQSSGGCQVHDQEMSRFGVWWRMHSWLIDGLLLAVSKHGGRGKRAEVYFLRAPILFMRVPPSWPTYLPKSPLSNTTTLRIQFSSVQSLICVRLFVTLWTAARHTSLSITNSQSPPKPMSIESVMPSYHLILCCPLLLLPPIPPSIRVFSNESALRIRWPKYWSFSFSIGPSNEYSGLISFSMDWLDLVTVWGTLKSLLQHHSSKASILRHSILSYSPTLTSIHDYWKNHSLTTWTIVGQIMPLLFNTLSRLAITFLPRNTPLLISWLQSPAAVILEPKKIKVYHCFHCFPTYLPWNDRARCHDVSFLNAEF